MEHRGVLLADLIPFMHIYKTRSSERVPRIFRFAEQNRISLSFIMLRHVRVAADGRETPDDIWCVQEQYYDINVRVNTARDITVLLNDEYDDDCNYGQGVFGLKNE